MGNKPPSIVSAAPSPAVKLPQGIRTINQVLGQEAYETTWVWEAWIATGGFTVFTGKMKIGKSTWLYALVSAIVRGIPFLNYNTRRVPVLIVCPEEHIQEINKRCWKFEIARDAPLYFLPRREYMEFFDEVGNFCKKYDIGLVIVDTLSGWWGLDDENDNTKVQQTMNKFMDLSHTLGIAVLVVHHPSKATMDDPRGASSLGGAVDQILSFNLGGETRTQRRLLGKGRYDETPEELILDYNVDTYEYRYVGTNVDALREAAQQRIKDYLLVHGPTPASVLATALKLKVGRIPAIVSDAEWCDRTGEGKKGSPYIYGVKA